MNKKMNFTNFNMNDCEKYEMGWGCDEDCPVFQNGDCEFQEELEKEWGKE